jgi:hypothetical protein
LVVTAGVGQTSTGLSYPTQRKSFYGQGRYWFFWSDLTNITYASSTDGVTWAEEITVRACTDGKFFAVCYDDVNNKVHYAYSTDTTSVPLYYARGTPASDGSIAWDAEVEAVAADATYQFMNVTIAVDSSGYPFIGYRRTVSGANASPWVTKSSTNDGTWTTAASFPYQLKTGNAAAYIATIVPLTSTKMLALYHYDGSVLYAKRYDGSNWGTERSSTNSTRLTATATATSVGDTVYVAHSELTSNDITFAVFVYADDAWSGEANISSASTTSTIPTIAANTSTGDLYCFWLGDTTNHVYYKKYSGGSWDVSATDWATDATLRGNNFINSFSKNGGSGIGVMWIQNASAPYNMRFNLLTLTVAATPRMNLTTPSRLLGREYFMRRLHKELKI